MPLGNYENWDACIADQLSKGKTQEAAEKICGALEQMSDEPPITYEREGEYTTIRNVDIAIIGKEGGDADFNMSLVAKIIDNFEESKAKGHLPTVFLGHNEFTNNSEKPAVGRMDNLRIFGKKLYADIIKVKNEFIETIKDAYPSRSIEYDPTRGVLAGMALLGSREPFYHMRQLSSDGQFMLKFCDTNNKTILINTNLKTMPNIEANQTEEVKEVEATEEVSEETPVVETQETEVEETEAEETETDSEATEEEEAETEEVEAEKDEDETETKSRSYKTMSRDQLIAELNARKAAENELVQKLRGEKIAKSVEALMNEHKITANEAKEWKSLLKDVNEQKEEKIVSILNTRKPMKVFSEIGHAESTDQDSDEAFNNKVNEYAKENNVTRAEAAKALTSNSSN